MSLTEKQIEMEMARHKARLDENIRNALASRKKEEAKDLFRCKGRLVVHKDFLLNPDAQILSEIFRKFYPIDVTHEHMMDEIVYFGYSYEFRQLNETDIVPMYRAIFTMSPEGVKTFSELRELDPDFIASREIEDGQSDSLESSSNFERP